MNRKPDNSKPKVMPKNKAGNTSYQEMDGPMHRQNATGLTPKGTKKS